MNRQSALELFDLTEVPNRIDLRARWHKVVAQHHPDAGGDPKKFQQYQHAYKVLLVEACRPVKCGLCTDGAVVTQHGFYSVSTPCGACDGRGEYERR